MYKATKTSANGDVKTNARATVEDEGGGEDADDDLVAGPELPPDGDENDDDDEDGRFFGSGLTKNTTDVMDFIDEQDNNEIVRRDARYVELAANADGPNTETRDSRYSLVKKAGFEF